MSAARRRFLGTTQGVLLALLVGGPARAHAAGGMAEAAAAYKSGNYAQALKQATPLAKAGNADAQHLLGLMYYMGRGVPRDYRQAMVWHRKAAEQGKADAQYVVGAMYYTGNAVPQDHRQAVEWFRKAAEQGHAEAQHALGLMYRYHVAGVPQDKVIAYMLWNLAAAAGHANAAGQRSAITRQMSQEQIEEGQALSRDWRPGMPLPTRSRTGASGG
ncbi:MAG: tetratricopeptide repeat protein [Gammaproteobacteria bacterium]